MKIPHLELPFGNTNVLIYFCSQCESGVWTDYGVKILVKDEPSNWQREECLFYCRKRTEENASDLDELRLGNGAKVVAVALGTAIQKVTKLVPNEVEKFATAIHDFIVNELQTGKQVVPRKT